MSPALSSALSWLTVVRSVDKAAETRISGGFGYGSHHLVLRVTNAIEELVASEGWTFEVLNLMTTLVALACNPNTLGGRGGISPCWPGWS